MTMRLRAALAFFGISAFLAACSIQGNQAANPASHGQALKRMSALTLTAPLSGPPTGAYFGAQVNPNPSLSAESQTETLEQSIGRPLALHNHYIGWNVIFPDSANVDGLAADYQRGRVPVVAWGCTGSLENVITMAQNAAAGQSNYLSQEAAALKAYPGQVIVRWFWEMNANNTTSPNPYPTPYPSPFPTGAYPHSTANGNTCIDTTTDPTTNATNYKAAWDAIRSYFLTNAGLTNVTFMWNPTESSTWASPSPMYPGDSEVDWIANDIYDYTSTGADFSTLVQPFYTEWSTHGKPMSLTEIASLNGSAGINGSNCKTDNQSTFIGNALTALQSSFPDYKAFMWFDGNGNTGCWPLTTNGQAAFGTMGQSPYMNAIVEASPVPETGSGRTVTISTPTYSQGTYLLAYIAVQSKAALTVVTPPNSGWTQVASYGISGPTGGVQVVFSHYATGSESSFPFSWPDPHTYSAILVPFSGVNQTTALDSALPATFSTSTAGTSFTTPAQSPTNGGEHIVTFFNVYASPALTVSQPGLPWTLSSTNAQGPYVDVFFAKDPTGVGTTGVTNPGATYSWGSGSYTTASFTAALLPAVTP